MRTFVALDLPDDIREEVAELIDVFRSYCPSGVNWVPKENLHITFQFIGETKQEDLNDIGELMGNCLEDLSPQMFSKPELEFVPGRAPKIIWLGLQAHDPKLHKSIKKFRSQIRKMGYKIDSRRMRFHITLGRIKKRLPEKTIKQILTTELKIKYLEVSKATLYKSLLQPQGSRYFELINFEF